MPKRHTVAAGFWTPPRSVAALIAITLVARLLFAASLGLGIDESYMVAAGRSLQLGYLDHPPASWWLAWAATHVVGSDNPVVVRVPFIALFALSTWLMYRLAAQLFDERAGFWAAVVLNTVPVLAITAGTWVLPDGPLIATILGATLCLVHGLAGPPGAWRNWLGAGACLGLALCSKYTVLPTVLGVAVYLVTEPGGPRWLARPQPYVAAVLASLMFAPVLAWNARHGWASILFQGGRMQGGKWHPWGPLSTIAGEALFFVPWVWLALAWCVVRALRTGPADPRGWLLASMAVAPFAMFELASLHAHVMYHWAAPGMMMAIPLLGYWISQRWSSSAPLRGVIVATIILVPSGTFFVASEVRFNWMPEIAENFRLGADPDLAAVDWTSLHTELTRRGLLGPGVVLAAIRWSDAGKIDYAMHGEVKVICLGSDPREYGLIAPAASFEGHDVLITAPKETLGELSARFGANFDRIEALPPVMLLHAGKPAMWLPLFRAVRLHGVASEQIRTN